jgi:hypothetical protein
LVSGTPMRWSVSAVSQTQMTTETSYLIGCQIDCDHAE